MCTALEVGRAKLLSRAFDMIVSLIIFRNHSEFRASKEEKGFCYPGSHGKKRSVAESVSLRLLNARESRRKPFFNRQGVLNMPIYEYECKSCGELFEHLLLRGETGEGVPCPACKAKETQRRMSTFCSLSGSGGRTETAATSSCSPSGGFS